MFSSRNRRRASSVDRRNVTDVTQLWIMVANSLGRGVDTWKMARNVVRAWHRSRFRAESDSCSRSRSVSPRKPPFVAAPRILSSYLRTSNYSSAHLTRMNDIVKVSSRRVVGGRRGEPRRRSDEKQKRLWNAHQVRTSPRRYSVGPNRHDVRSSAQQLSHESTCSTRLHQDLTARRLPHAVAHRFRRLWLRFFFRVRAKKQKTRAGAARVPGRERVCQG